MEGPNVVAVRPGKSAFELMSLEVKLAVWGWVSFGVGCVVALIGFGRAPLLVGLGAALFLTGSLCVSLYNTSVLSLARQRAESALGYTTVPKPHSPRLRLVLPRSGLVVRDLGEAPMEPDRYREMAVAALRNTRQRGKEQTSRTTV